MQGIVCPAPYKERNAGVRCLACHRRRLGRGAFGLRRGADAPGRSRGRAVQRLRALPRNPGNSRPAAGRAAPRRGGGGLGLGDRRRVLFRPATANEDHRQASGRSLRRPARPDAAGACRPPALRAQAGSRGGGRALPRQAGDGSGAARRVAAASCARPRLRHGPAACPGAAGATAAAHGFARAGGAPAQGAPVAAALRPSEPRRGLRLQDLRGRRRLPEGPPALAHGPGRPRRLARPLADLGSARATRRRLPRGGQVAAGSPRGAQGPRRERHPRLHRRYREHAARHLARLQRDRRVELGALATYVLPPRLRDPRLPLGAAVAREPRVRAGADVARDLAPRAVGLRLGRPCVLVTVYVRLFAGLRERAGWSEREVDAASVADVWPALELGEEPAGLLYAVNQEYAEKDRALSDGDEVAVIPPVSGGAFRLVEGPLDLGAVIAEVED